jgi:hypothetical protein
MTSADKTHFTIFALALLPAGLVYWTTGSEQLTTIVGLPCAALAIYLEAKVMPTLYRRERDEVCRDDT